MQKKIKPISEIKKMLAVLVTLKDRVVARRFGHFKGPGRGSPASPGSLAPASHEVKFQLKFMCDYVM